MRALAILLVVGFHADLPGFPGGFVGVDVFFVISGYLITRNLLRESSDTGGVALLAFWGRRIRRLVPAMFLMIVVVFGLSLLVLSPLDFGGVAREGRAAALYVSNIFYARQATDYFAADVDRSLFLHTWSLGVEEQFYLVWPVLFGAACLAVRRRRDLLRAVLAGGFAVTLVVSLALNLVLTERGSPWAFFSLPTRAWEFAAAGLLAAWSVPARFRRNGLQVGLALVGLALIAWSNFALSASTPYPGAYALLPVLGTLLVILAGETAAAHPYNVVNRGLAVRPAQWLGRVSYSWYLWHWPLILLAVAWRGSDSRRVTAGAALVALAVAAAAYHWYENPIRFSPRVTRSKPRTYALGATLTAIVLVASVGVTRYGEHEIEADSVAVDAEHPANRSSGLSELNQVRAARRTFTCPRERTSPAGIDYCEAGPEDADTTVFLIGDSHTRHWSPAFIRAADELGVRLVIRWRPACPSTNLPGEGPGKGDCGPFQRDTDQLIDDEDPEAVVFANSNGYRVTGGAAAWEAGLRDRVAEMQRAGRAVGVVADTPQFPEDPVTCLSTGGTVTSCAIARDSAFLGTRREVHEAERRVVSSADGAVMLDVNDVLCGPDVCPVQIDGLYVYTDREHLYDKFVVTLTPQVVAFLRDLVPPRAG